MLEGNFSTISPLRRRIIPRITSSSLPVAGQDNRGILVFCTDTGEYRYSDGLTWIVIGGGSIASVNSFHKIITGTALTNAFSAPPIIISGGANWSSKLLDIISCSIFIESTSGNNIANSPDGEMYIGIGAGGAYNTFGFVNGEPIEGSKKLVAQDKLFNASYNSSFTGIKLYIPDTATNVGFDPADKVHVFGTYQLIERNPS